MVNKLKDLDFTNEITIDELLLTLKKEAVNISITDIMTAHNYLVAEGKYVQGNYREEYLRAYVKGFILRLKEIKDNKNKFKGTVGINELKEAVKLLNEQEKTLLKIRSKESHFLKYIKLYPFTQHLSLMNQYTWLEHRFLAVEENLNQKLRFFEPQKIKNFLEGLKLNMKMEPICAL